MSTGDRNSAVGEVTIDKGLLSLAGKHILTAFLA